MALASTSSLGLTALAIGQFVLVAGLVVGRLWALRRARSYDLIAKGLPKDSRQPKVSVQIATYAEPPELVLETLRSLKSLSYNNYQVLVVDNNTSDPALYEPVRDYCEAHGFDFVHLDNVQGAKAGALNLARPLVDPQAEYVLILDADYVVEPGIIETGLLHFRSPETALVQFPQSYRNGGAHCPLAYEYRSFFHAYMTTAQVSNSVLATGTAAFVRQRALDEIGGWPTSTITEDADLGLRLHRAGYRGIYVNQTQAQGLLPGTLSDFFKQRSRWIMGNLQCLRMGSLRNLSWDGRLSATLQLTAWVHPLIAFPFILLGCSFLRLFTGLAESPSQLDGIEMLCVLASSLYIVSTLLFFSAAAPGTSLQVRLGAVLVHLATFWTSFFSVFRSFTGEELPFIRTNKFKSSERVNFLDVLGMVLPCLGFYLGLGIWSSALCGLWLIAALPGVSCLYLKYIFHQIRKRSE